MPGGARSDWPGLLRCHLQRLATPTTWNGEGSPQRKVGVTYQRRGHLILGREDQQRWDNLVSEPEEEPACPGRTGRGVGFSGCPSKQAVRTGLADTAVPSAPGPECGAHTGTVAVT